MADREKVKKALRACYSADIEWCQAREKGLCDYKVSYCRMALFKDAAELLEAQEPHIITEKDFENNPSVDENGYLPAYCEKIDRPIGWMAIHKGYIGARKDIRYWTGKPTEEQREAVKWE